MIRAHHLLLKSTETRQCRSVPFSPVTGCPQIRIGIARLTSPHLWDIKCGIASDGGLPPHTTPVDGLPLTDCREWPYKFPLF